MFVHRQSPYIVTVLGGMGLLLVSTGPVLGQTSSPPRQEQTSTIETTQVTPEDQAPASEHEPFDLRTTKTLTGDWGGLRTELEDMGIKFKIKFMNQLMVNMHGGLETKNGHDTAGSSELSLYLDLEKMNIVKGGEFFIRAKSTWGGDDSDFDHEKIGAFFKTNQDAGSEEPIFIDKWHYKQTLMDGDIEFRFGRMEPVKDLFDCSKVMGDEDTQFLNRALVRNATIPSNKGLGVYGNWDFTEHAYIRAAALDANSRDRRTNFDTAFHGPDEFRFYAETGCKPKFGSANGDLPGHYRIGTWYDPTEKTKYRNTFGGRLPTHTESGDWGLFLGFEQMVWKENADEKDSQGLTVAGRYGWADGDVNRMEHFWSAAVQYHGLIPTRDKDTIAFGVGQGIFSDDYRYVRARADRETVYELYYSFYITPWLTISPDFQYICNAGGDSDDPDAAVAGLRVKMAL